MKIVELPDKKLRERSLEVVLPLQEEDKKIAQELIDYIELSKREDNELRPGVGIAAVQLGYLKRMFYVDTPSEKGDSYKELLINPIKVAESEQFMALEAGEGCLSVPESSPNLNGLVHRKAKIIVKGFSYFQNKEVELTLIGFKAIVFQHELDHLDGKLFFDRINHSQPQEIKKNEIII